MISRLRGTSWIKPGAEKGKTDLGKHLGMMETAQGSGKGHFKRDSTNSPAGKGFEGVKGIFGIQTWEAVMLAAGSKRCLSWHVRLEWGWLERSVFSLWDTRPTLEVEAQRRHAGQEWEGALSEITSQAQNRTRLKSLFSPPCFCPWGGRWTQRPPSEFL